MTASVVNLVKHLLLKLLLLIALSSINNSLIVPPNILTATTLIKSPPDDREGGGGGRMVKGGHFSFVFSIVYKHQSMMSRSASTYRNAPKLVPKSAEVCTRTICPSLWAVFDRRKT